ncbi:chemotaxis-specific protein-glutamate methyltransferase CheB [Rhizorhabdus dicambivorans]|uniref:protein-glutamate methylesterase n=1 Tax=Rhizorhabdus dicambivorans TaxID=1850238 RepID=A0A2A4G316_9SPHN|nr:chemotaxis-specific protein-glutamate methyltransferase CheB [Rhizorhabdus dicambivorans]ATE64918.1 chemotaxis-specific protein-glutamate methyltransferase CheB [Rhizorhabdus dicambivorans]PCE44426.1 chemotaxis-specific protein-glutamate methyltransferase CheB [Rhizorhabdus dicambivorans]
MGLADGGRSTVRPIRVLLVDDSLVARTVLARLLDGRPEFEIAGAAPTADQAILFLSTHDIDIVVLDVEMPGKDGLTALPEILEASHGARVLIVSSAAEAGASATVRALTLGAADTLLKPTAGNFAGEFAHKFIDALLRIGHANHDQKRAFPSKTPDAAPRPVTPAPIVALRAARSGKISCLAIGASTGGLHALSAFLRRLTPEFRAPILITQHLPPPFMPYFAAQLRDIAGRPTSVATDGAPLVPGQMLVAPGEGHIRLARSGSRIVVRIDPAPAPSRCMPSVDPMFEAVAEIFGGEGVGVVLTGMGRDGTIGAEAMVKAGAEILAQDSATSVVWGMPGSVAQAGLASLVMPPEELARHVCNRNMAGAAWK